jgi:hypothetical protein
MSLDGGCHVRYKKTLLTHLFPSCFSTHSPFHLSTQHFWSYIMSTDHFSQLVQAIVTGKQTVSEAANELYGTLGHHEKLGLLDGDLTPFEWFKESLQLGYCGKPVVAGAIPRVGFPGIRFSDGPRGVNTGTCFPTPSTRANTFNVELEEQIVSGRSGGFLAYVHIQYTLLIPFSSPLISRA